MIHSVRFGILGETIEKSIAWQSMKHGWIMEGEQWFLKLGRPKFQIFFIAECWSTLIFATHEVLFASHNKELKSFLRKLSSWQLLHVTALAKYFLQYYLCLVSVSQLEHTNFQDSLKHPKLQYKSFKILSNIQNYNINRLVNKFWIFRWKTNFCFRRTQRRNKQNFQQEKQRCRLKQIFLKKMMKQFPLSCYANQNNLLQTENFLLDSVIDTLRWTGQRQNITNYIFCLLNISCIFQSRPAWRTYYFWRES